MKWSGAILFFLLVTGLDVCKATTPPTRKLIVVFHNRIGKGALVLDDTLHNILGDVIVVERFRYYVSNFSVTDPQGKIFVLPAGYFLVDEADSASRSITLTVPDVKITGIHFLLGVDSIRNVSGIQTGALDPLNGMFWTWNSGYIMAKLEGASEKIDAAGHRFTYHIGGFRNGMSTAKNISIALPGTAVSEIHLNADVNAWFKGSSELKIAETPVCHSPGALAQRIADNYSTMFSLNSVR